MKRIALVLALACLVVLCSGAVSFGKLKVAVVDFANKSSFSGHGLGNGISDMFVTALVKTNRVSVVERDQLKKVLDEQGFSNSSLADPSTAIKVGKILGVQYIILGNVTEYGVSEHNIGVVFVGVSNTEARVAVDARVIDTTNGEIIIADSGSGSDSESGIAVASLYNLDIGGRGYEETIIGKAARKAVNELAGKVAVKFTLKGKVIVVTGDTVKINLGKNAGMAAGMVMDVTRRGEEIKDPDTGEVLEVSEDSVGRIEITSVKEKISDAKVKSLESGKKMKVGDIVNEIPAKSE
jgi:curli biogenesis system outer membrane secretion channel CsgG